MTKTYAVERVIDGKWSVEMPDYPHRKDAVERMRMLLSSGDAIRGQIQVIELLH